MANEFVNLKSLYEFLYLKKQEKEILFLEKQYLGCIRNDKISRK